MTWTSIDRKKRYETLIRIWQGAETRHEVLHAFRVWNSMGEKLPSAYRVLARHYSTGMTSIMQDVRYLRKKGVQLKRIDYSLDDTNWERLGSLADESLLKYAKSKLC